MTMLAQAIQEIKGSNGATEVVDTDTGEVINISEISSPLAISDVVGVDRTGLTFTQDLSPAEWMDVGNQILDAAQGINWAVGDILVYGEDHHGREIASQLYDAFSQDVIEAAIYTCRAIPKVHRRSDVPYSHHRYCTKYDAELRGELLAICADRQFTIDEWRAFLKAYDAKAKGEEPPEPKPKCDPRAVLSLLESVIDQPLKRETVEACRFWLGL